jgi:hypothetical protein
MSKTQKLGFRSLAALLGFLGAFLVVQRLGLAFGLWGSRARDVVYGDEMNLAQGFVLLLVAIELYRGKKYARIFPAMMAVVNAYALFFHSPTLAIPVAFYWLLFWIFVFAVASWPVEKTHVLTRTEPPKAT